jgi:outer membrane lipoprotein-sorting protein
VDQILDKYVAALGGRAALEKHTSRVSKGTLEIPDAGMTGSVEVSEKAPGKSLTVIDLPGVGMVREGSDGSVAWSEDPQTGLRDKAGSELADALRGSAFNPELRMKSLYKTLEVVGRETVGARATYVVLATPDAGSATRMYFDAETGLLLRQGGTRETQQGPLDIDLFIDEYRDVDGVKEAVSLRQVTPMFTMVIRLADIKHNVALDDAIFKRPGGPIGASAPASVR